MSTFDFFTFSGCVMSILTKKINLVMRAFSYDVISKMASINFAKLGVILKISMKHGVFGIKFVCMKHRIRRDVVK